MDKKVFISGEVTYGDCDYRVCSPATLLEVGEIASLVTIDEIDGDSNATVYVANKYINFDYKEE